jgi:hypothetical protein
MLANERDNRKWRAAPTKIVKMERKERNGSIYTCLWTEPDGGNPAGFVHPAPNDRSLFDVWSTAWFNDQWQYFIED